MKKKFIIWMVISFAIICSCQKQDSATERQLAQRKTELDAREEELRGRENAVVEREKALAERERALTNRRTIPSGIQGHTPEPEQVTAEIDSKLQQLPAKVRTLIPDRPKVSDPDPAKQEPPAPRQLGPEDLQRQWQRDLDQAKVSGSEAFPAAEATSPSPSPTPE
jgi:hypothetical protein